MPIKLFTSNRMEILADAVASVLRHPPVSHLAEEIVVVQSVGMKRWLSMAIARRNSVCANTRFLFPNAFLYEYLRRAFPDAVSELAAFDVEAMTWRIMGILRDVNPHGPFAPLAAYMSDDPEGLKQFQLAARIADTFDQYLIFRPDMIFQWEAGQIPADPQAAWQARLWNILSSDGSRVHRAGIWQAFIDRAKSGEPGMDVFPERVSVFGISTLPAFHMHMLASIARSSQVTLYLLNPCRQYWGDLPSGREVKAAERVAAARNIDQKDLHLAGNPLLSAMGLVARDFFDMLNELDCEEASRFADTGSGSMLAVLQQDILDLKSPNAEGPEKAVEFEGSPPAHAPGCGSLMISACHGPMREVQVLHDNLLAMFEADSSLRPEDILVMAPDIETYAPYIQAVFDPVTHDGPAIPYTIADRSPGAVSPVIETFFAFFDLFDSRFTVADVLDMLERTFIRRHFNISTFDMTVIVRWIDAVNIRWGIDGTFKTANGLPGFDENTWLAGFNSMVLGYAMAGEEGGIFDGTVPCDQMDAGDADILEKLVVFWRTLLRFRKVFGRRQTARQWRNELVSLIDAFFHVDAGTETDIQMLLDLMNRFQERCRTAGFEEVLSPEVVKTWMRGQLEKHGAGTPFIAGGATFCSLLPMRSIPFPVICLLGMNVDDYPRHTAPPGFDLISKAPRRGDRSRRYDDRYLFLETLLSARKRLYISYTGFDIQDNSRIPPSVLVSELMDYLDDRFYIDTPRDVMAAVKTDHRLQPFHPDYFTGHRRFSYGADHCETARHMVSGAEKPPVFDAATLNDPDNSLNEDWRDLSLSDICAFFMHPVRYFLNHRLGIYPHKELLIQAEDEPFHLSGLDQYAVNQQIVGQIIENRPKTFIYDHLRAGGKLPHGAAGKNCFERLYGDAAAFVAQLADYVENRPPETAAIDLSLDGFRIYGTVDNIYNDTWLPYRYANLKARDLLRQWIVHLCLNEGASGYGPMTTVLAGKDRWFSFSPVHDSETIIKQLLRLYNEGMMRPLHFFPESAFAYADFLKKGKTAQAAFSRAVKTWTGNAFVRGEQMDACYRLCFGKTDPLDGSFRNLAEMIFGPLQECVTESGGKSNKGR